MQFFLRRLVTTIPVIIGVCTITFFMVHAIPGDPVDIMLGEMASESDKQALREKLHLTESIPTQFILYLKDLASGNLGQSLSSRSPVTHLIAERLPATFELTIGALAFALLISLPLGVISAVKKYQWPDHLTMVFSMSSMSLPGVFLGPMLIWIFALKLNMFPVSERGGLEHLVLPALSLGLPLSAVLMRLTRTSMLEVIHEDYIRVARAKGLSPNVIYMKHALRNALIPVITVFGLQVGAVLTGTVITETIFDWPGIGTLLYDAIQNRDYPVIQGCTLVIALIYVSVHFLTDVSYTLVNPKMRGEA